MGDEQKERVRDKFKRYRERAQEIKRDINRRLEENEQTDYARKEERLARLQTIRARVEKKHDIERKIEHEKAAIHKMRNDKMKIRQRKIESFLPGKGFSGERFTFMGMPINESARPHAKKGKRKGGF